MDQDERAEGAAMSAAAAGPDEAQETRSPEEIRADIEQTREEVGDTVEALAAKTDVKAQARERARRDQGEGEGVHARERPGGRREGAREPRAARARRRRAGGVPDRPADGAIVNKAFTPIGLVLGLAAGQVAKKIFDKVWGLIRDEEAPRPKHRELSILSLVGALLVEGAIARVVRGMVDHGTRHGWRQLTGTWPGEERPEEE